jgi:hypothetical protein
VAVATVVEEVKAVSLAVMVVTLVDSLQERKETRSRVMFVEK